MRKHNAIVSQHWLCRSACESLQVTADWLAQISSSAATHTINMNMKTCRVMLIQHLLHSLSIVSIAITVHSSTTSTELCLTTLNCKGRLPLEALVVSRVCVLLYNGPVGLLLSTAGLLNGVLICSSPLLRESLSLPLPFLGPTLQLTGNEMSVFTPSPDY